MIDTRKLIHASALVVPILTVVTSRIIILVAMCTVVVLYSLEEALRLKGRELPLITKFTLRMSRPQETAHFIVRPIYLAVGIILSLLLFPVKIAAASIVIVAVGDPVAAYVGGKIGRRHIRSNKTVEGSIAGLVASFLLAALIVYPLVAFVGATGAMLMELIDQPDDNLTMPIAAGALMTLVTLMPTL
jgi:dolichol kinase